MKKLILWITIPISVFFILTVVLCIVQQINYKVHGPYTVAESKYFNVNYIRLDHKILESDDLNDYLVTTVEIENKTPKKLYDFQFKIKYDEEMQNYAPIIFSESSKITLSGKSSENDFRGNVAVFTNEDLILKPSLLSEDDRRKMLDLVNNMTLELSWHSGIRCAGMQT